MASLDSLEPSHAVKHRREIAARPASSCCDRPARLRAARNMPPVISTIVMFVVCVASAHVNVSVLYQFVDTARRPWPTCITPRWGLSSVGQRVARPLPERWPADLPRKVVFQSVQGHRAQERGQPGRCPFLIGSGNGRQDAQPCSTCRPVALLRRRRLDLGLFCLELDLLGARWSRRYRDSLGPLGLTWTKTISHSSAPQSRVRPASGATTTTMCLPTARWSAAS